MADPVYLDGRSWHWLRDRIFGLLDRTPTVMQIETGEGFRLVVIPSTRIGMVLDPPDWPTG